MINSLNAQLKNLELQAGYFAPYLSNIGGSLGCSFDLKEIGRKSNNQLKSNQVFQLLPQVSYFTQTNVSQNFLLNPELVYKWNKLDRRFFLTSSLGLGYLLSLQKQDGILNLGTGSIEYRYNALNYFLPTLNLGLGIDPKRHIGFFFKTSYGRKLSAQNVNSAFFGISTGLIIKFHAKQ